MKKPQCFLDCFICKKGFSSKTENLLVNKFNGDLVLVHTYHPGVSGIAATYEDCLNPKKIKAWEKELLNQDDGE